MWLLVTAALAWVVGVLYGVLAGRYYERVQSYNPLQRLVDSVVHNLDDEEHYELNVWFGRVSGDDGNGEEQPPTSPLVGAGQKWERQ